LYFQRLHISFKENQYPDRATKESLAQELGLTCQQVISFSFTLNSELSETLSEFRLWLSEFLILISLSGCQMVWQYTMELPALITNENQFREKWRGWMWINVPGGQRRKIKSPKLWKKKEIVRTPTIWNAARYQWLGNKFTQCSSNPKGQENEDQEKEMTC